MASMFKIVMSENVRAVKDALQNLNIRKSKKDQVTGISSENSENYELSQNARSKLFSSPVSRVLNSKNKPKTHDRERNLSPML